jgi:hypothetical protein
VSTNQVLVYEDSPNKVLIDEEAPTHIVVQLGMAQSFTGRHVHDQAFAAASWAITHALGGRPQVTIVDTSDTVVVGDVTYTSDTQLSVSFTAAFSGKAYLT